MLNKKTSLYFISIKYKSNNHRYIFFFSQLISNDPLIVYNCVHGHFCRHTGTLHVPLLQRATKMLLEFGIVIFSHVSFGT